MRPTNLSLTLAAALLGGAILAACGETTPTPATPSTPGPSATSPSTATPPATTTTPPAATTAPPANTGKPDAPKPEAGGDKMKPIIASAMAADLKEAGLDITKLVPMSKMKGAEKSKVMKAMSKATGMECKGCHVEGDFKKDTPNKLIARHMWDEYVVGMKMAGGDVFCDSCHQGHDDILTHGNKDAVSKYMDESYVKKLVRKDGKEMGCPTCHTADFEMKIIEKVWKIKKAEAPIDSDSRVAQR